jgi:hypothetical protein
MFSRRTVLPHLTPFDLIPLISFIRISGVGILNATIFSVLMISKLYVLNDLFCNLSLFPDNYSVFHAEYVPMMVFKLHLAILFLFVNGGIILNLLTNVFA